MDQRVAPAHARVKINPFVKFVEFVAAFVKINKQNKAHAQGE
jgi:hypothetical protein